MAATLVLLLVGCENSFVRFYEGERAPRTSYAFSVDTPPEDVRLLGQSSFVSATGEGDSQAISAARTVGADYVVWNSEYQGTTSSSGVIPITTPTTTTTHYSGYSSGNVYGQGGYLGSYSANSYGTATSYGSTTNYIPYNRIHHWMRYSAKFYRSESMGQMDPATSELTAEQRLQRAQSRQYPVASELDAAEKNLNRSR